MHERQWEEYEHLAALVGQQPPSQRHGCCGVAKGVDEGKCGHQRSAVAGCLVEQTAERRFECAVLDADRHIARQRAECRDLASQVVNPSLVLLDEQEDELDAG